MPPSKDRTAAAKRIDELVAELNRHSRLYHLEDRPEISDAEYDRLFRELLDLEAAYSDLRRPDSPSGRVGEPPASSFAAVEHRIPMLSLDCAFEQLETLAEARGSAGELWIECEMGDGEGELGGLVVLIPDYVGS